MSASSDPALAELLVQEADLSLMADAPLRLRAKDPERERPA